MTRIIAGAARGYTLGVPKTGTRPTSDRVREALFSSLDARLDLAGAAVLDLYAGSGALGLEAVSRGATEAVFVERAPKAVQHLKQNIQIVKESLPPARLRGTHFDVSPSPVRTFLLKGSGRYDLVFIDPPYELDEAELAADLEALVPRLAPDALVVIERGSRTPPPVLPAGLELDRAKAYGETVLYYVDAVDPVPSSGPDVDGDSAPGS